MHEPPDPHEAERRFRALIADAGLAPPDEVVHQEDQILFLWNASKTAVVLELGDEPASAGAPHERAA